MSNERKHPKWLASPFSNFQERVERAAEAALKRSGSVGALELFQEMGLLHDRLRRFQNEYKNHQWGPGRTIHNWDLLLVEQALAICLWRSDSSALNRLLPILAGFESIAPVPIISASLARCAAAVLALLDGHAGGGTVHAH